METCNRAPPCSVDSSQRKQGVCSFFLSLLKTYGWKTCQLILDQVHSQDKVLSPACFCTAVDPGSAKGVPSVFWTVWALWFSLHGKAEWEPLCVWMWSRYIWCYKFQFHLTSKENWLWGQTPGGRGSVYKLHLCNTFGWPCRCPQPWIFLEVNTRHQHLQFFLSSSFTFVCYFLNSTEKCSPQTYFSGQDKAWNDLERPDTVALTPPFRSCSFRRGLSSLCACLLWAAAVTGLGDPSAGRSGNCWL